MSDKMSHDNSLANVFEILNIDSDSEISDNKNGTIVPPVPNATHDLTCRRPQTTGDMDNSDDTDMDSDVIVVVDSSNASSDVSCFSASNLSTSQSVLEPELWDCLSDTDTIPETESDSNTNGSSKLSRSHNYNNLSRSLNHNNISLSTISITSDDACTMDSRISTPIKRKQDCYPPNSKLSKSCNGRINLGLEVNASPVLSSNVITTRSGRTVRARIDNKFDYSSEPQDVDSDDSDDPDFGDNEFENDDEDNCHDSSEPTRKQRRISMRNSCCSSDASSMLESDAFIYLDLKQPVAIVKNEPTADAAIEFDSELKTRLQKLLGLVAPQRRLYNPMSNFELEDNHMDEDDPPPTLRSRLWTAKSSVQPLNVPMITEPPLPSPVASRIKALGSEITNDMKMLLIDDMVQRANANYFESQTPQHIKEPIDLSGLPSEEQRALNCQQHKKIPSIMGPYTGVYSFVDSLRSTTPLNMCHPLAVNFRKREFGACKVQLAKTLFNILNHTVFHCGLRPSIVWRSCMNTPSSIEHRIEAGGQRLSRIVLWQNIKQPGMMVKVLLHEMCHAAAFVYHGETGHGDNCRKWAYRAKSTLPELPEIGDCNASYKYTCLLCRGRSFGRIKFEDEAEQLRCHYCQFEVNVEACSAENVHNLSLTDQLVTPYKEFVRANYGKCEQSGHSAKMQALNVLYKEHQQQAASN
ncbi:uncharacterized protein LOC135440735 isoform X1 [Drosophila montana]|uniref:uncharacterized protein LOC135440735 isoform X1 n=2 Tax=Drosophila montana TaxID=40370 RepID=UPI00313A977E